MRNVFIRAGAIAALILTATVASAQQSTIYCLVEGGDAHSANCSFTTMEACMAARAGGSCVPYTVQK